MSVMALRFNNDRSSLFKELEEKQGKSYLPGVVYVHTDKKGFKRIYMLNLLQRIFIFFEDPKFCYIGNYFGSFMLFTIVTNLVVFIVSSLDQFKYTPDTCTSPACHDGLLCPGKIVCEPVADEWTRTAELICVIILKYY